MSGFDRTAYYRARCRRGEQRNATLESKRAQLERLLALALNIAATDEVRPLVLLGMLEELDRLTFDRSAPPTPVSELAQLLATDPDGAT